MTNRLAAEPSPYLLQHANNPVDWYPWGDEAFDKARRDDRPIFLSVGYSTCHWCHVMEHESFENAQIASVLNEHFVSIKVDREERPDVDRVYMTFVQTTTGGGGWPMSVWLTPELKPFYGGTYFPPTSRWGRPGFIDVLKEIARVWRLERDRVLESAETLLGRLKALQDIDVTGSGGEAPQEMPAAEALSDGIAEFRSVFDRRHGGFGQAPKFPRPSELVFLLRAWARTGDGSAREMAVETLRSMALGGMRDHLGGGFHRYSVDEFWRVPHFEKMLYDQAQLALAYLEAAQATDGGDRTFLLGVAEDTLEYVRHDMTHADGGFYSAEDADSVPPEHAEDPSAHKSEGAFYIWSERELESLLGADTEIVRYRFGIEPQGNAPSDPQGEFRGKNLLYIARSIEDVSRLTGRSAPEVERALANARLRLLQARVGRPRPGRDDKVLTAWNGLMIAAFARAARVVPGVAAEPAPAWERASGYLEAARRAARFLRLKLWDETQGALLRRFRDGQASINGYAEDFACLIWGLIELFQADGNPEWLEWARTLQQRQDTLFWDERGGGWFSTTGEDSSVLLRMKEDYDGAEPASGSVSALNLLSLAHLTGNHGATEKVERALRRYGLRLGRAARVLPFMLCGLATYQAGVAQTVIVGPRERDDTRRLLAAVASRYLPFALTVPVDPGNRERLAQSLPLIKAMAMRDGHATAHVCVNFTCLPPITDASELVKTLES